MTATPAVAVRVDAASFCYGDVLALDTVSLDLHRVSSLRCSAVKRRHQKHAALPRRRYQVAARSDMVDVRSPKDLGVNSLMRQGARRP